MGFLVTSRGVDVKDAVTDMRYFARRKLFRSLAHSRLVFSRFLDLRVNLGSVKEKLTRKTYFPREKKRLAPRIYQAKFCLAAFL